MHRTGQTPFYFTHNENGWRDSDGHTMPLFADCREVDLNLTPFTNTIPIRRLYPAVNTAVDITVMYFDLLAWTIKPVPQRYAYQGLNKYFFESFDTGFTSTITVDDHGIVIDYPCLWRRIYSMKQ